MKYTKQQRRDLHKAFKAAQPYLEKQGFICWAVSEAHKAGKIDPEQVALAKSLIEHRIHPYATVYSWLRSGAGVPDKKITPKAMRAYRERWLASLVKEFSK